MTGRNLTVMEKAPETKMSAFRRSHPGERFQERYWRHRHATVRRSVILRLVLLIGGGVLGTLGFVLLFIPGPGLLLLALGAGLAATESLVIARICDAVEIRARAVIERAGAWWRTRKR